jgi:hypothetical protein
MVQHMHLLSKLGFKPISKLTLQLWAIRDVAPKMTAGQKKDLLTPRLS